MSLLTHLFICYIECMPINKSAKHINLLPQDDFQTTGIGRVLKWALSTFRVMVIVTELVVMSAFLSRFWLDSKNSDLNEAMGIKKAQVMAYKEVEKEFRSYQTKLSIASSLYLEGSNAKLLKGIQDLMPSDVILTSFAKNGQGISIKALSFSERSIAQFLVNLESLKTIKDVELSQVSTNSENSAITLFTISAKTNLLEGGSI